MPTQIYRNAGKSACASIGSDSMLQRSEVRIQKLLLRGSLTEADQGQLFGIAIHLCNDLRKLKDSVKAADASMSRKKKYNSMRRAARNRSPHITRKHTPKIERRSEKQHRL